MASAVSVANPVAVAGCVAVTMGENMAMPVAIAVTGVLSRCRQLRGRARRRGLAVTVAMSVSVALAPAVPVAVPVAVAVAVAGAIVTRVHAQTWRVHAPETVPLRRGGGTGQDQADENDQRHRGRKRPHATVTTRQVSLCANLAGSVSGPWFRDSESVLACSPASVA
jgi:hypothetical protein